MRVKFTAPYRYVPSEDRRITIRYKPGTHTVRRECGEAAIAAGVAKEVKRGNAKNLGDWDGDGAPGGDAAAKAD